MKPPPPTSADAPTIFDGPPGEPRTDPLERIGTYRVEGRLGSGGMGEVFLAWDERLERRVAIKRIRREAGLSPDQRERFRREARLAGRLNHPAVVQIHDLIPDGPDDAIVMEYVEGRTLVDLLQERMEMPVILRLACEIAEGLAAAHEAGLVHRDLKAGNVIVTPAGHAKILDFGLARPVIREQGDPGITRQGIIVGTCHAMSPEQARGEEVDVRSDLFSFGTLVHEMLTGRPPFRGTDPIDTLRKVVTEEPVDPRKARPDLPREVAHLLRRLLKKNRDERPASAREVVEILERFRAAPSGPHAVASGRGKRELDTGETTPLALPAPFRLKIGQPAIWTRRRILLAVAAVALFVAGAVAIYLKIRSARPLEVAVIIPEPLPEDEDLKLAARSVLTATLEALTKLEEIKPLDPDDIISDFEGSPIEEGKAVGAEQILTIRLAREDGTALVTFQRSEVSSKRVLQSGETKVVLGGALRRDLTNVVLNQVHKIFPDHKPRPGTSSPTYREEDLDAFVRIQQRVATGEARRQDLEQLEKIMTTSPRFPGAPILASRIAYNLFLSQRDPRDLDRASAFARQAETIDPEDPRPLRLEFQIALTRERPREEVDTILEKLEQFHPGDPDILPLRADLAESQGNLDQAAEFLAEAIELNPSWQNLYLLASLEARRGRIYEAREQINDIFLEAPENVWAREALGNLELTYGDLEQAEKIYGKLVASAPDRALNNLGTIQTLRGRYKEARDIYREARMHDPHRVQILINLAEVEIELGNKQEAEPLYREVLELLEQREKNVGLTPSEALLMAQCHARLGETQKAVAIVRGQLSKNPEDAMLLFQSVLVYSITGDRAAAKQNAISVLDRGFKSRWFAGSALKWLHQDAEVGPRLKRNF